MADDAQQFIEELYNRARQDGEEPSEVAERVYQNARGVSRRELMQAGGGLGVGALLGGAGGYAAVGGASADPSTSDSDGNVGTPSDPVDVFAEGLGGPTGDVVDVGSNLDLKSSQKIQNAASISTDSASINNLGSRAINSANPSISSGTITKIPFDSTTYNDTGEFDTSNHNFVPDDSGKYSITAQLRVPGLSSDISVNVYIYKNGSRVIQNPEDGGASGELSTQISDKLALAAGDTVDIRVFQDSGGPVELDSGNTAASFIQEG